MESLPLLPGYVFSNCDPKSKDYKLRQKLKFLNGFQVVHGSNINSEDFVNDTEFENLSELTYGPRKSTDESESLLVFPQHVLYDRMCLRFEAFFKQGIFGSDNENYRVHRVNIFFYLEDDTMAVIEPTVENAGYKQGKLVRRGKIPKSNDPLVYYRWQDLNIGLNIAIYGVVYHIVDCDLFSRTFLNSQGIDVPEPEDMPFDPYTETRRVKESAAYRFQSTKSKSHALADDERYRFLEYDRMVLSFDSMWEENLYKIRYYLVDNTIAVSELRPPNAVKEMRNTMLLKRTKVPKNWKEAPLTYPAICLEKTDAEVSQYYAPCDLKIGETIFIFGRRFLLYDCDAFTRKYYADMLGTEQPLALNLAKDKADEWQGPRPKPESKKRDQDLLRQLYHFPKKLRYNLALDALRPEDEGRKFILEYSLANGAIRIIEVPVPNSGRSAGRFLNWMCVPKPKSDECFSPNDFFIGAKLNVLGHWFIVTGTELFVYNYMKANPKKFDEGTVASVREHLKSLGLIDEPSECEEGLPKDNPSAEPKDDATGASKRRESPR